MIVYLTCSNISIIGTLPSSFTYVYKGNGHLSKTVILPTLSFPTKVYFVCFFCLIQRAGSIKAGRGDMDNIQPYTTASMWYGAFIAIVSRETRKIPMDVMNPWKEIPCCDYNSRMFQQDFLQESQRYESITVGLVFSVLWLVWALAQT